MSDARLPSLDAVLLALIVAVVAWGVFAFGAVYPWAYTPLAIGCATIGVTGLVTRRRSGPRMGALSVALSAVGLAIALQLVPLSARTFVWISPAGDAVLRSYDLAYGMASLNEPDPAPAGPSAGPARSHPISIAPTKTAIGLALFAAFALFLGGIVRLLSTTGAATIVRPLVGLGFTVAVFGIVQAMLLTDPTKGGVVPKIYGFWQPRYGGNPFGPFVNRNHFAGWALMSLSLALAAAYAAWERGKTEMPDEGFTHRLAWLSSPAAAPVLLIGFAAAIVGLALLMTESRSGAAAFATAAVLFAWVVVPRQPTRRARIVAGTLLAIVFGGIAIWAGVDPILRRVSSVPTEATRVGGRLQAWSDTGRIVRDFAITGAGFNAYGTAMMMYQTAERQLHYQEAHNDYLQLAAEGGLLVGVPILLTIAIVIRDVRRRFREAPKSGTTYWLRVGAAIGIVSVAVQSLVEFSLQMPGNAVLFAVLAGIALHRSPNLRVDSRLRRAAPGPSRANS